MTKLNSRFRLKNGQEIIFNGNKTISKKHIVTMVKLGRERGGMLLMEALKNCQEIDKTYLNSPCGWITMEHVIFRLFAAQKFDVLVRFVEGIYRLKIRVFSQVIDAYYTSAKKEVNQTILETDLLQYDQMKRRWNLLSRMGKEFPDDFPSV